MKKQMKIGDLAVSSFVTRTNAKETGGIDTFKACRTIDHWCPVQTMYC